MASIVTVLIGQCGTQLGTAFFHAIASEAEASGDVALQHKVSTTFFRRPRAHGEEASAGLPVARCVVIDMEPKVIQACCLAAKRSGLFQFSASQCIAKEDGSANNWAFGYCEQGESRREAVLAAIRKEVGAADAVEGFHLVHSIAGGTGSGIGSLVSECVRAEFPTACIMHTVVWPFASGEVTTQWYNALFCTTAITRSADGVLLLSNDEVGEQCKAMGVQFPKLDDINRVMATTLAMLLLPSTTPLEGHQAVEVWTGRAASEPRKSKLLSKQAENKGVKATQGVGHRRDTNTLSDIITASTSASSKIFSACAVPPVLATSVRHRTESVPGNINATSSSDGSWRQVSHDALRKVQRAGRLQCIVLRGSGLEPDGLKEVGSALSATNLSTVARVMTCSEKKSGAMCRAHVAITFTESRALVERLRLCAERAEEMWTAGAFVHHFQRYGVTPDQFKLCLARLWDLSSTC